LSASRLQALSGGNDNPVPAVAAASAADPEPAHPVRTTDITANNVVFHLEVLVSSLLM
jgi:hypothetical protein